MKKAMMETQEEQYERFLQEWQEDQLGQAQKDEWDDEGRPDK